MKTSRSLVHTSFPGTPEGFLDQSGWVVRVTCVVGQESWTTREGVRVSEMNFVILIHKRFIKLEGFKPFVVD